LNLGTLRIHNSCRDEEKICKAGYSFEVTRSIGLFQPYFQEGEGLLSVPDFAIKSYTQKIRDGGNSYSQDISFQHDIYQADYGAFKRYLRPFALDPLSAINYLRSIPLRAGDNLVVWVHQNQENYPLVVTVSLWEGSGLRLDFDAPVIGFMWPFVNEFEVIVDKNYPHVPLLFKYPSYFGAPVTGTLVR
jgi:hypothetical protein